MDSASIPMIEGELYSLSWSTDQVKAAVQKAITQTTDPTQLGKGKDAGPAALEYTGFEVVDVVKIRNDQLLLEYDQEKQKIRKYVGSLQEEQKLKFNNTVDGLPPVDVDVNECYLFHAASPGALEGIKRYGFDPRYTRLTAEKLKQGQAGGMLGIAAYFTEDMTKADQYLSPTADFVYIFLAKVCLGKPHFIEKDFINHGLPPGYPIAHQSVVAKNEVEGKHIRRFREFAVYEKRQSYPEYLISLMRICKPGQVAAPAPKTQTPLVTMLVGEPRKITCQEGVQACRAIATTAPKGELIRLVLELYPTVKDKENFMDLIRYVFDDQEDRDKVCKELKLGLFRDNSIERLQKVSPKDESELANQLRFMLFQAGEDASNKSLAELVNMCSKKGFLAQQLDQAVAFIASKQSQSFTKPKPPVATCRTIAIICIKTPEYIALSSLIQTLIRNNELPKVISTSLQELKTDWCAHQDVYHFQETEKSPEFKLILVCFGNAKGPVATAARVGMLVSEYNPDMVGMTGICAGRQLGTVYVAFEAICPEFGRIESQAELAKAGHNLQVLRPSRNAGYSYLPKDHGQWKAHDRVNPSVVQSFHYPNLLDKVKNDMGRLNVDFKISEGTLYSFNQVRNDCEEQLKFLNPQFVFSGPLDPLSAIDMEAQALFHSLALLNVKALPVVKAVSDVGQTQMRSNMPQFKAHCPNTTMDHDSMRKKYRVHAAENAAKVMAAFIRHLIEIQAFMDLR